MNNKKEDEVIHDENQSVMTEKTTETSKTIVTMATQMLGDLVNINKISQILII
jgi:hypothetical protein